MPLTSSEQQCNVLINPTLTKTAKTPGQQPNVKKSAYALQEPPGMTSRNTGFDKIEMLQEQNECD